MALKNMITDRAATDVSRLQTLISKGWSAMTSGEKAEYLYGYITDLYDAAGEQLLDADGNLLLAREGTHRGAYNYTDLNRVGTAILYLQSLLSGYGYSVSVSPKTDWAAGDWPTAAQMTQYLADLYALKEAFYGTELPGRTINATNLFENSDFADGLTGWGLAGATGSVSGGVLGFTTTYAYGDAYQLTPIAKGDKVYIRVKYKTSSATAQIVFADYIVFAYSAALPATNDYEEVGVIFTVPSGATVASIFAGVRDATVGCDTVYVDYGIVVNLTDTFGAGNEPTQTWCDANISYFDGTETLIQAMDNLTYEQANNIERLLLKVEEYINRMIAAFRYSGTFYAGQELILP